MKLILLLVIVAAAIAQQNEEDQRLDNLFKDGNNQFSAKMFSEVVKNNPDKSVILSAFSVLTPLAQLSLASEGASHDELLKAIGSPDDNSTKEVFTHLNKKLQSVKGIELKTVSKIYVAKNLELNPDFSAATKQVFNSEVQNVDFSKKTETANEINQWVEEQTNDRIKDLVKERDLGSDIRSILVNAIYFKGAWSDPFTAEDTKEEDFHVSKDKTVKVSMMHKYGPLRYADSTELNSKVVELPYEGHQAFFTVILPNEVDGLAALVDKLKDPSAWASATSKLRTFDVNLSLPKFKIETETDLKDVLEKIEVKRIFNSRDAQLTRLLKSNDSLVVSKAIQKAFLEVHEKGSEAAAGNQFSMVLMMASPPATFHADHPFVFMLNQEDNILFTGVFNP